MPRHYAYFRWCHFRYWYLLILMPLIIDASLYFRWALLITLAIRFAIFHAITPLRRFSPFRLLHIAIIASAMPCHWLRFDILRYSHIITPLMPAFSYYFHWLLITPFH
jgi:hypothetical protein